MVRVRFPHRRRQTSAKERERLKEKEVLQTGIKLTNSPRNSGNSEIRGQERARRMLRIGTISTTAIFVATVTTVASMIAIFILALHFPCKQISLSCDGEEKALAFTAC